MTIDPVCRCPNMSLRFLNPFNRPLKEANIAIETSQRRSFVTDGFGSVSWYETEFSPDGKVFIEYLDGGRHLAWSAKLPDAPGRYDLHLNVWTNDADGRE